MREQRLGCGRGVWPQHADGREHPAVASQATAGWLPGPAVEATTFVR